MQKIQTVQNIFQSKIIIQVRELYNYHAIQNAFVRFICMLSEAIVMPKFQILLNRVTQFQSSK